MGPKLPEDRCCQDRSQGPKLPENRCCPTDLGPKVQEKVADLADLGPKVQEKAYQTDLADLGPKVQERVYQCVYQGPEVPEMTTFCLSKTYYYCYLTWVHLLVYREYQSAGVRLHAEW
jgi:hypothetical protein